jgi:putative transposase
MTASDGQELRVEAGPGGHRRRAGVDGGSERNGLSHTTWTTSKGSPQRDEGLKVPYPKRKKPLRGIGTAVAAMWPIAPNAPVALDFQFDVTVDGRTLKLLNSVDDYTRECPAIVVDRTIDADRVVATLDRIAVLRGAPAFVRFDHGPEFIAYAVTDWCRFNGVGTVFIDPGSRWQNAWIETFNGRLRDELLNGWIFDGLLEAQVLIEDWRVDYNNHRPHSAHGDLTPTEFAQAWTARTPTSTRIAAGPLTGTPHAHQLKGHQ